MGSARAAYTPGVTDTDTTPSPDPADLAHSDVESGIHPIAEPEEDASAPASAVAAEPPAKEGPGKIDAFLRRFIAGGTGLALVISFFLEWQQPAGANMESYTGLKLVMADALDQGQKAGILAVPALGTLLIALGYWGRRPALLGSLLVGLGLLLMGTWQTLAYLAQSIGPGLWMAAGAAFIALLGGIPWQRIFRGMRAG